MKKLIFTAYIAFAFIAPFAALAADEYGDRFTGETPAGLAEGTYEDVETPAIAMDDEAVRLQDIIPAAGDDDEDVQDDATTKEIAE